jgi:hypothetical protein
VRGLLAEHQAHEVKAIGDALMIRAVDAAAAIRLSLCIVHDVGAQHGFPLVRVGMHTGPAVEREGDWFGATVNLAARVSAAAAGGEALLTETTRAASGDVEGVELRERGRWSFRNVGGLLNMYAAVRQGRAAPPACRLIRSAGWRWTHGTVPAGSPTTAWSTASARSAALAPSLRIQAGTRPPIPRGMQPLTDHVRRYSYAAPWGSLGTMIHMAR